MSHLHMNVILNMISHINLPLPIDLKVISIWTKGKEKKGLMFGDVFETPPIIRQHSISLCIFDDVLWMFVPLCFI